MDLYHFDLDLDLDWGKADPSEIVENSTFFLTYFFFKFKNIIPT